MNDIRTALKALRNERLGTKACSALALCTLLAAMAAVLISPARSAGGADEKKPASVAASAPNAKAYFLQPKDVVLFLGNSITAGAQPEMDFLVEDFRKQYPALADGDGKVKLVTAGIGGEQAVAGAKRLKALLAKQKPTVCVVCYGTCEVTFKNEKSFIRAFRSWVGQSPAEFRQAARG